jgi:hypothetical protein
MVSHLRRPSHPVSVEYKTSVTALGMIIFLGLISICRYIFVVAELM